MRDPARIDKYIDVLRTIWKEYPDWRFGQLVCNINKKVDSPALFFIEDEDFFANIVKEDKNV